MSETTLLILFAAPITGTMSQNTFINMIKLLSTQSKVYIYIKKKKLGAILAKVQRCRCRSCFPSSGCRRWDGNRCTPRTVMNHEKKKKDPNKEKISRDGLSGPVWMLAALNRNKFTTAAAKEKKNAAVAPSAVQSQVWMDEAVSPGRGQFQFSLHLFISCGLWKVGLLGLVLFLIFTPNPCYWSTRCWNERWNGTALQEEVKS